MELLVNGILEDLGTELGLTEESDLAVLSSKIRNAYREVKRKIGRASCRERVSLVV